MYKKLILFLFLIHSPALSTSFDVGYYTLNGNGTGHPNEDRFLCIHNGEKIFNTSKETNLVTKKSSINKYNCFSQEESIPVSLFALFDGHKQRETADFLAKNFWELFKEFYTQADSQAINTALEKAIKKANAHALKNCSDSGSTLVCVLYNHETNMWHTAHVGDSRALICNPDTQEIRHATEDHNLKTNTKEQTRVLDAGGFIGYVWDLKDGKCFIKAKSKEETTWYKIPDESDRQEEEEEEEGEYDSLEIETEPTSIHMNELLEIPEPNDQEVQKNNPQSAYLFQTKQDLITTHFGLAMSRSIGDAYVKISNDGKILNALTASPEITTIKAQDNDAIIIGSDGFWDEIDNVQALKTIQSLRRVTQNPTEISTHLCNLAQKKGSSDDITVLVVINKEK